MSGRAILRAVLLVLALQVVAFALWTLIARPYTSAYCRALDLTPLPMGDHFEFIHRPRADDTLAPDNMVIGIGDRAGAVLFTVPYGAGPGSYFPNAFLLALVVATPLRKPRRARLALPAFALLQGALMLRVLFIHLKLMSGKGPWAGLALPEAVDRALHVAVSSFSYSATSGVFTALLIWAALVAAKVRE